jgi:hypothetical protein
MKSKLVALCDLALAITVFEQLDGNGEVYIAAVLMGPAIAGGARRC